MALRIYRASSLPADPEDRFKDCIYLVKPANATTVDIYVVDKDGAAYTNFNEDRFRVLFEQYSKSIQTFFVTADIAERDELEPAQTSLVFVMDASGDPNVVGDSALYLYNKFNNSYNKVYQSGGVDWDFLVGGPASTAEEIDDAVSKAHSHDNKSLLDVLGAVGEEDEILTYKTKPVTTYLVGNADW